MNIEREEEQNRLNQCFELVEGLLFHMVVSKKLPETPRIKTPCSSGDLKAEIKVLTE